MYGFRVYLSVCRVGSYALGYTSGRVVPIKRTDFYVYGHGGSPAQTYADSNGLRFIDLDAQKYTVEAMDGSIINSVLYSRVTEAYPGERLRASIDIGMYKVFENYYEFNGNELEIDENGYFIMPDYNVLIGVNYHNANPETVDLSSGTAYIYNDLLEQLHSMIGRGYLNVINEYPPDENNALTAYDIDLDGDGGEDIHLSGDNVSHGNGTYISVLEYTNSVTSSIGLQPRNYDISPITFVFAENIIENAEVGIVFPKSGDVNNPDLPVVRDSVRPVDQSEPYTVSNVHWYNEYGVADATFEGGKRYFVSFDLVPDDGYAFTLTTDIGGVSGWVGTYKPSGMNSDGSIHVSSAKFIIRGDTPHDITVFNGIASSEEYDYTGEHIVTSAKAGDTLFALPCADDLENNEYFVRFPVSYTEEEGLFIDIDGRFVMPDRDIEITVDYETGYQRDFNMNFFNGVVEASTDYDPADYSAYVKGDYFGISRVLHICGVANRSEYNAETERIESYYDIDGDGTEDIHEYSFDPSKYFYELIEGNSIAASGRTTLELTREDSVYSPIRRVNLRFTEPVAHRITVNGGVASSKDSDFKNDYVITEAFEGDKVYILPDADELGDDKYVVQFSMEATSDDVEIYDDAGVSFVMPDKDVTVDFEYESSFQDFSILDYRLTDSVTVSSYGAPGTTEAYGVSMIFRLGSAVCHDEYIDELDRMFNIFDVDGDGSYDIEQDPETDTYYLIQGHSLSTPSGFYTLSLSREQSWTLPYRSVMIITADSPYTYPRGDVNHDGVVNIIDATYIQKAIAHIVAIEDSEADFDGNGVVDVNDVTILQKYIAKLIEVL